MVFNEANNHSFFERWESVFNLECHCNTKASHPFSWNHVIFLYKYCFWYQWKCLLTHFSFLCKKYFLTSQMFLNNLEFCSFLIACRSVGFIRLIFISFIQYWIQCLLNFNLCPFRMVSNRWLSHSEKTFKNF